METQRQLAMDTDGLLLETVFSAIKRMFGEYIMARKYHPNMVKEMFLKVLCCAIHYLLCDTYLTTSHLACL